MADIFHDFPIVASRLRVFQAISTPAGLDAWWTKRSSGEPRPGAQYELWFGPEYDWRAVVSRCVADTEFELTMTTATDDWRGTKVGFLLTDQGDMTEVRFHHVGWPGVSDHYRTSSFCWAMYLRLLKRHLEHGEQVPYEVRLDA